MRWCVVYADGARFSSDDGAPADAPGGGVVAIAQEDEDCGCRIRWGEHWFIYHEAAYGGWMSVDHTGLAQHLLRWPEATVLKMGQCVSDETFRSILESLRRHGLELSARRPDDRRFPQ